MKDLKGRKVKGFKFDKDNMYNHTFDRKVGIVGRIVGVFEGWCTVHFSDDILVYPLDQIEAHLVPEMYNNFEGWFCGDLPKKYEIGKEYEFTHKSMRGWDNRKLLAVLPTSYNDRFIVTSDLCSKGWTYMSEIREIKPKVKELTLEEAEQNLTQFLGIQIKIKK